MTLGSDGDELDRTTALPPTERPYSTVDERAATAPPPRPGPPLDRTVHLDAKELAELRRQRLAAGPARPAAAPPRAPSPDTAGTSPEAPAAKPLDPRAAAKAALAEATAQLAALLDGAGYAVDQRKDGVVTAVVSVPWRPDPRIAALLLILGIIPGIVYLLMARPPTEEPLALTLAHVNGAPFVGIECRDEATVARVKSLVRSRLAWNC